MNKLRFSLSLFIIFFCTAEIFSQWTNAINIPSLRVMAMTKCGNDIYAGTSTGILNSGQVYKSTDQGATWNLVNTGYVFSGVFTMASRGNFIYVGTYEHGLLMSADGGLSWTLNDMGIWRLGVFGVGVSGDENVIAYINHGTGLNLSTNLGYNWSSVTTQVSALQSFLDFPGQLLAGSRKGVALSLNEGANWSLQSNSGITPNPDGTKPMRAIHYFNNKLFAGCINKIYSSSDFGNNFTETNFLLNNFEYVTDFVSYRNKLISSINTASSSGTPAVIMTTDDGLNWTNFQDNGFPGLPATALEISDDYVIAGTQNSGIWIRAIGKTNLFLKASFEGFTTQDTITVELRSSIAPYNLIESQQGLSGNGVPGLFKFVHAVNGTPYYIVVKHRNSIETWSAKPVVFQSDSANYDFTSSQSQAFGSNLTFAKSSWSFYTGDVNQDGFVDLTDGLLIYNDAIVFANNISSDLNRDGVTDLGDLILYFNNAMKFVSVVRPN